MRDNTCLAAALEELSLAGVRDIQHANGGRHRQLRWGGPNGATRFYNVSVGAPSDSRSVANTRANVRRILRADGLLIDRAPPPPRPLSQIERLEQRVAALELEVAQLRRSKGDVL
jgi:hypothetical protein